MCHIPNVKSEREKEKQTWPKLTFFTCVFPGSLFSSDWHPYQPTDSSDQHLLAFR